MLSHCRAEETKKEGRKNIDEREKRDKWEIKEIKEIISHWDSC